MEGSRLAVVALGGNAMQQPGGEDSVAGDFERTSATATQLVGLVDSGWRLVVTHGNGPQVGNHLLRSELGHSAGGLPLLPLDVCVADTQGGMGYMLQQCLANAFAERGQPAVVTCLVTQVLVDANDPAFERPTKPVGEMIPADKVDDFARQGWRLLEDKHRHGWRRVVASPDPKEIIEAAAVRALVDDGTVVIAAGGGGVPVVQDAKGVVHGVPAVIDKDLASALLAIDLRADALLILTDVDAVRTGFDTPEEKRIEEMTIERAEELIDAREFGEGSMEPKVRALCRYVAATRGLGAVAAIEDCDAALAGKAGTRVTS